jgi:calcineurin-like phosphoesterase family protein
MSKKLFSSDWHIGEVAAPNNHSYLSHATPTERLLNAFLNPSFDKDDTFYFLGDSSVSKEGLDAFLELTNKTLPKNKYFILGDKETDLLSFKLNIPVVEILRDNGWIVKDKLEIVIGDIKFKLSHKPTSLINEQYDGGFLCGHVHGIWRTQKTNNGIPIINVGIDAWANEFVTEDWILHQYNAVTKGYYDNNCFINL